MPLRDHFRASFRKQLRWESFHSAWVNTIVRDLNGRCLPARYRAEPQTHAGSLIEVDVQTMDLTPHAADPPSGNGSGTAVWAPPKPTHRLRTDFGDPDIFEARVYDEERDARLVAAVEMVSPGNKDRKSHRRDFVLKCASYLRANVAVVIIDIITERNANLFAALMQVLELEDAAAGWDEVNLYATALRPLTMQQEWDLETWPLALQIGAQLPTLPLWLGEELSVPLDLERTYEETCQVLRLI
jgi:hypothetical protein